MNKDNMRGKYMELGVYKGTMWWVDTDNGNVGFLNKKGMFTKKGRVSTLTLEQEEAFGIDGTPGGGKESSGLREVKVHTVVEG